MVRRVVLGRSWLLWVGLLLLSGGLAEGADAPVVRVLSFNIWVGGEAGGQPLERTADVIRRCGADIVGLQEGRGREVDGQRPDHAQAIAGLLGWYYLAQKDRRSILSRFPIRERSSRGWGAWIEYAAGRKLLLLNAHFAASPYQPYQLLKIPYGDAPFVTTAAEAEAWAGRARGRQVGWLLEDLAQTCDEDDVVLLTGDFNEPSWRDWTAKSQAAGHCPLPVKYPATWRIEQAGLTDTWRVMHPNEVEDPGITWTPLTQADDPEDHHDRIDFVFSSGDRVKVLDCQVVGEAAAHADIVVTPWPSDHRAVLATLQISAPSAK